MSALEEQRRGDADHDRENGYADELQKEAADLASHRQYPMVCTIPSQRAGACSRSPKSSHVATKTAMIAKTHPKFPMREDSAPGVSTASAAMHAG